MLKKTVVIGAAVALLLGLFMGRSHVRTAMHEVKDHVKNSMSIEYQLKHARQMIKDLQPEIESNLQRIAQEEVEVAKLERRVADKEEQLANARVDILRLKNDLDSGSEVFVYSGSSFSAKQVKADLTSRFEQFKTEEATADSLNKILLARQRGLTAAREKLDAMLDSQRQLRVDVENLEARLAMVDVAQASSDFNFDDSQLARTRELVEEIGTRIEVAERLVNVNSEYLDRIPLDEPSVDRDITEEVADYFGEGRPEVESIVNSND